MTITQTVDIPASHRLTIDVPREVPAGPTVLAFTPAKKPAIERTPDRRSEPALSADEGTSPHPHADTLLEILSRPSPHTDALLGILSGLGDITLEQIRDERLAKHLK